jgi:hypothetical protein
MAKQMGYLFVDHSASPGLPEDIALAAGYDPKLCKEGKRYEADTMGCAHCTNVVLKNPFRTRERHYCAKCSGAYICDPCAYLATLPDYVHVPRVKVVESFKETAIAEGSPPQLILPWTMKE